MIIQPDRGEPVLLCGNRCLFGCGPGSVILEANSKLQTPNVSLAPRLVSGVRFVFQGKSMESFEKLRCTNKGYRWCAVCTSLGSFNISIMCRAKSGRSGGKREVTRFLSRTTGFASRATCTEFEPLSGLTFAGKTS